jgi:hypothetical protein
MMKLRDLCFRLQDDTLAMTWTSDRGRPWQHNIAADRFWVVLRLVPRRLQDGEPLVLQELISDTCCSWQWAVEAESLSQRRGR